jgi:hypothetical protein
LKFLQDNGFPIRYQRAIHPKATSDDEADQTGATINHQTVRWIKSRPERSAEAERFIRRLEELREENVRYSSKKRWNERPRRVPATNQKVSTFLKLPENMPIDYFEPSFYNQLLPRLRFSIAEPFIVFLPDGQAPFGGTADEKLSTNKFNHKYGEAVLSKYELVTEDDFADDEEDDEDEEMRYVDEVDEQDDNYQGGQPGDEEDSEFEVQQGGQPGDDGDSEFEVQQGMETEEDGGSNESASGSDQRNKKRRRS